MMYDLATFSNAHNVMQRTPDAITMIINRHGYYEKEMVSSSGGIIKYFRQSFEGFFRENPQLTYEEAVRRYIYEKQHSDIYGKTNETAAELCERLGWL